MAEEMVTLDISTLTLGEMSKVELASGQSFERLIRGRATMRLVAMFIHELRTSAAPRSWQELSSLRLSDVTASNSPSSSDGASQTSKASLSET